MPGHILGQFASDDASVVTAACMSLGEMRAEDLAEMTGRTTGAILDWIDAEVSPRTDALRQMLLLLERFDVSDEVEASMSRLTEHVLEAEATAVIRSAGKSRSPRAPVWVNRMLAYHRGNTFERIAEHEGVSADEVESSIRKILDYQGEQRLTAQRRNLAYQTLRFSMIELIHETATSASSQQQVINGLSQLPGFRRSSVRLAREILQRDFPHLPLADPDQVRRQPGPGIRYDHVELLVTLQVAAAEMGVSTVRRSDFERWRSDRSAPSVHTFINRFGSWEETLTQAGLDASENSLTAAESAGMDAVLTEFLTDHRDAAFQDLCRWLLLRHATDPSTPLAPRFLATDSLPPHLDPRPEHP
jgi:nitroreductase